MACEKCWDDAYLRWMSDPSKTQTEHYQDLLNERKDNPCGVQYETQNYLASTGEEMECQYCLDGDVPTEEVLPNDERIMAHWVNGICRECKDFQ